MDLGIIYQPFSHKRRRAVDSLSAVDAARQLNFFEDSLTDPSLFVVGSEKSPNNERVGSKTPTPDTGRRLKGDRARLIERSERRVSPDLPFNLVTGESAGTGPSHALPTAEPGNTLSLLHEAVQADQTEEADRLRELLKAELVHLGMTELGLYAQAQGDAQEDPQDEFVNEEDLSDHAGDEQDVGLRDGNQQPFEGQAPFEKGGLSSLMQFGEDDGSAILEKLTTARKIDKFVLDGLPAFDLDSAVIVSFAFDELESRVHGVGLNLNRYVPRLISLLVQRSVNAKRVRVHSVQTQFHTQKLKRAGMDYAAFRRTCEQVSAGEVPRYNIPL